VEAAYRKKLRSLIDSMASSVEYWLTAQYRKRPPRVAALAQDATPFDDMDQAWLDVAERWQRNFDESAPRIAEVYASSMFKATDTAFKMALKDAGWSVAFKMTPAMRDAFSATVGENVGLIKSIPEQYLQQVQGVVARAYTTGRDLETMVRELRELYPKATNRAVLIARDQSNKANAVVTNTRMMELGITEAIWMHSSGGKEPRPDHVAANGKKYKIAEGCLISGEYILPGQKINCRCTSRAVLPI
jgi:SPP1 gp7 family putative phage head morphogenesis protein